MTRGQWIALIIIVIIIIIVLIVGIVMWNRNKNRVVVDINRTPVITANVTPPAGAMASKPIRVAPLRKPAAKVEPTYSVVRGRLA